MSRTGTMLVMSQINWVAGGDGRKKDQALASTWSQKLCRVVVMSLGLCLLPLSPVAGADRKLLRILIVD